ncbi:hypothetical protein PYW08_004109 [Mythimna loreyi]|uniref:Uncharacterized protein n=1 Tax=Mythimna loreyi TaxID=667449 RepID=A0ACC2QUQ2_9NEOP|nr:hypothetical protein PYW08_004109 [Mythimna loreyi]
MPKKRSTSWSRIKKEKQIITARLIEISMKLEDCIYKQKPISGWEAEKYIREVSSFKSQCSRDERSLQVIEKLTRCMKAIILDNQEPAIHTRNESISIPADVVRARSLSPVYSIPEEDRSRLTQIAERANENIEIIDLSNIDDDDDSMLNETNNATAGYTVSKEAVDVDIHRDMSSLSLRDLREPLDIEMSTETNSSQSILNNFEGVEQMEQNTRNITSQRTVADKFVDNVTETPLLNNRPISTTGVIKENTATTKKKRGPKKKLKDEKKEIKQKKKTASRAPKTNNEKTTTKNKIIPIYNKNVVDDLSWIENIRYVREIRADENDSKLHLDESFWDNFYLPANWTENEFM